MPERRRWLVVGHGSVGASLVRRLQAAGVTPAVMDPAPRIPVPGGLLVAPDAVRASFDVIVSCVTPSAAADAARSSARLATAATLMLDWNTLLPTVKADMVSQTPASVVDVALLDTLDTDALAPALAIAGPRTDEAAALLQELGFGVSIVGSVPGDAARLKLARSLFMKTLEALVVEFEGAIAGVPGADVVRRSIEANTGPEFAEFARLLLRTDRVHAARRAIELAGAVSVYADAGRPVDLARSAIGTLESAASAWDRADAPPVDAPLDVLARHLAETLYADR